MKMKASHVNAALAHKPTDCTSTFYITSNIRHLSLALPCIAMYVELYIYIYITNILKILYRSKDTNR